jgi:hypothetical protein
VPYEIRSASNRTNRTITFDFSATVQRYVVGVTYWKFRFSDDNHHVKRLELSILSNHVGSRVTSTVTAHMQDSSGHDLDDATSDITLTCVALVNADTANAVLTTVNGVGAAGTSVPIVGGPHSIALAVLEGWNIAYAGDDHHIEKVQLAAGLGASDSSGTVSATAYMSDNSRNIGAGTVDASIVAANTYERGLLARLLPDLQTSRVETDFGVPLAGAGALIQSFLVEFSSDDHHVRAIGGGVTNCTVDGTRAVLTNPRAFVRDDTDHKQGDGLSRVSMAVFAVPRSP